MRILFFTLGNEMVPSSRTRVYQFLPHLRRHGVEAMVIQHESSLDFLVHARFHPKNFLQKYAFLLVRGIVKVIDLGYSWWSIVKLLVSARNYDAVCVQKVLLPSVLQKALLRSNENIFFDFDDAIYADNSWDKVRLDRILSLAKLVTIENEETENYVRKFGVPFLRITGPIDCSRYKPVEDKVQKKEIVIGWIGSASTTPYVSMIQFPLQKLSEKYRHICLELIGAAFISMNGIRVRRYRWSLDAEVELLSRFDIGIMPMPDNKWTRGKGGYKLLQYMAMGIPCISSPVGINREIVKHDETGYLAETEEDWLQFLERLILDDQLRTSMGRAGRQRAQSEYSFETFTPRLVNGMHAAIHGK